MLKCNYMGTLNMSTSLLIIITSQAHTYYSKYQIIQIPDMEKKEKHERGYKTFEIWCGRI